MCRPLSRGTVKVLKIIDVMFFDLDKYFLHPFLVLAAFAVPALLFYCAYLIARRRKALRRYFAVPAEGVLARFQLPLIGIGVFLLVFSSARPRWGKSTETVPATNRNIVVAVDVSRSMLARDVRPDRLERAKADVADLIDSLEGDRCSLVAFRRTGVALCPLTSDQGFLRSALETLTPDSAPKGETDLGSAIRESLRIISQIDGVDGAKADRSAIILISDGGDLRGDALKEAAVAKERGVPVFTVGIGDPSKGAALPSEDGGTMKFNGSPVLVKLEEEALKAVAEASGGRYVPLATAGTAETTLGAIYRSFLRQVAIEEQNMDDSRLEERYLPFLAAGILFVIAGASLSKGRLRTQSRGRKS